MSTPQQEYFEENGHYGLIRSQESKAFCAANPMTLGDTQLPPVDLKDIPQSMKVADWMQVENQGGQGSCQGNALASSLEYAIYRQTQGTVLQLSRQFAYIQSQVCDGGARGDRGSTLMGGVEAAKKYGICLESFAPYTGRYYTQFSEEAFADAQTRKLRTSMSLRSYDDVLRWLVHGIGGVEIGISWPAGMNVDANGCVNNYRPGFRDGGHALVFLDWNMAYVDSQGRPYIDMFNSHGKNYGFKGRAFISTDVVEGWCRNEEVIGHSDVLGVDIKPRKYDWKKQSFLS